MTKEKRVFVIGLPKTGLTSLLKAFRYLGYSAHGTNKPALKSYQRNDLRFVYNYLDQYEAFFDWPIPILYKEAYRRYGDESLYILSLRRSPREWVESLKRHSMQAHPVKSWFPTLYGYRWPHGFEVQFESFYESYNVETVRFFEENFASAQLLEFCSEAGDSWPNLCNFIGCDAPVGIPFPRENVSKERKIKAFRLIYNTVASRLYGRLAPAIMSGHPVHLPQCDRY